MDVQASPLRSEFVQHLQAAHVRLYAYIHLLTHDVADADDLYQQTCLVLWRRYEDYDQTRDFLKWACGIARRQWLGLINQRDRRPLVFSAELDRVLVDDLGDHDDAAFDSRRDALAGCIQKLRDSDRDLLRMCYGEQSPVPTIAQRLRRRPQSIHNSLRRIRKALLRCVRCQLAEGGDS